QQDLEAVRQPFVTGYPVDPEDLVAGVPDAQRGFRTEGVEAGHVETPSPRRLSCSLPQHGRHMRGRAPATSKPYVRLARAAPRDRTRQRPSAISGPAGSAPEPVRTSATVAGRTARPGRSWTG